MKSQSIVIAAAFVVAAVALGVHLASAESSLLTKALGKAAWFLPYAAIVSAVRSLRVSR